MYSKKHESLLAQVEKMNEQELRRVLVEHLSKKKLGLVWESSAIVRDQALNSDVILPELVDELSCFNDKPFTKNLIIEGDNFDSLRLLRNTHRGRVRVIYIDPPYNTGNKDWVYNDKFVGENDRYRHSQWLEFMYQRMTLARDLLTPDGVILISINDENRSRLELMMDEVMPGRRLGSIVWRTRQGSNADQQCFLSVDHEHVLVYGNPGFSFNGFEKSYEMYSNPDNDPRGDWRTSDLTLGFSYKERPNLYYPVIDPDTGIYYPPNPDRIWVYASEARLKPGQKLQAKSMDEFIRLGQIIFPQEQRVVVWDTLDDLLEAIDKGDVPKSNKTPILRRDLPDIESWVGVPVGFGRPQFKRFKSDLRNQTQPFSSWIVPSFEDGTYEADNSLVSSTNKEGANQLAEIFGSRTFNYAKPVSLIRGLLSQATRPDDIVLDFFSGSGTTGHAVLDLNAEDGGTRTFILCSSTEATSSNSEKNLCRDICAERLKRVIQGYSEKEGADGCFAYIRAIKKKEEDLPYLSENLATYALQILSIRNTGGVRLPQKTKIKVISSDADLSVVVCEEVNQSVIDKLKTWPAEKISIYSSRPNSIKEGMIGSGKTVNAYSLMDVVVSGVFTGSDIYE